MTEEEHTTEETQDTPTETPEECPKSVKTKKKRVLSPKQKEVLEKNKFSRQCRERAATIGRKGGYAKAQKVEKLKSMAEWGKLALATIQHDAEITTSEDIKSNDDLATANLPNIAQIMYKATDMARKGNIQAATFVRDTIGEKPTDKHQINATIEEKPNKKKILQMMQKLDENPELERELLGND